MVMRETIAIKYSEQYANLDAEFFETIYVGTPKQERRLKPRKSATAANARFAKITQNYEAELKANGFEELNPEPEPTRDLFAEIDELRAELASIKRMA